VASKLELLWWCNGGFACCCSSKAVKASCMNHPQADIFGKFPAGGADGNNHRDSIATTSKPPEYSVSYCYSYMVQGKPRHRVQASTRPPRQTHGTWWLKLATGSLRGLSVGGQQSAQPLIGCQQVGSTCGGRTSGTGRLWPYRQKASAGVTQHSMTLKFQQVIESTAIAHQQPKHQPRLKHLKHSNHDAASIVTESLSG